jgi:hypothetical protein
MSASPPPSRWLHLVSRIGQLVVQASWSCRPVGLAGQLVVQAGRSCRPAGLASQSAVHGIAGRLAHLSLIPIIFRVTAAAVVTCRCLALKISGKHWKISVTSRLQARHGGR